MAQINPMGMGVLKPEHLDQINQGLQAVEEAKRQMELAKRAGVDVGPLELELQAQENKLRAIKTTYFPGQ